MPTGSLARLALPAGERSTADTGCRGEGNSWHSLLESRHTWCWLQERGTADTGCKKSSKSGRQMPTARRRSQVGSVGRSGAHNWYWLREWITIRQIGDQSHRVTCGAKCEEWTSWLLLAVGEDRSRQTTLVAEIKTNCLWLQERIRDGDECRSKS